MSASVQSYEGAAFERDIGVQLGELLIPVPAARRWLSKRGFTMVLLIVAIVTAALAMPNAILDEEVRTVTSTLGLLALWRYGWWMTHAIRSEIFVRRTYPAMRERADALWSEGWRPRKVHFMMTTYYEKPEITRYVIDGILAQIRETGIPAHVWIGTGSAFDERVITEHVNRVARDLDAELTFVRQNQPGKRMAIGLTLRAIRRSGAGLRDLVVFMDGDAVLTPGTLKRCAGLFGADTTLEALTTDEDVVCYGPWWMERWLKMRFAQRRIAMQSHALSGKVLTLTGRMSVFRANHVLSPGFIRTIEADHLDHWLWGRFRFLSGDDKSTWYYLLSKGSRMTYAPDVMVATVEVVEGSGRKRMVANLRRWSGNMLRNGARAIALGPRVVGPFIWWCLVDQRIAIWTMLASPILATYGALITPSYAFAAILWVLGTRSALSLFLFRWSREVDPTWPVLLYVNQVTNAAVKVFISFRLATQIWANRGNQRAGGSSGWPRRIKLAVANAQMVTVVTAFLWCMALWSGFAQIPELGLF